MSGIGATLCVHPMDVLRVRLQLDSEGGSVRKYRGTFHLTSMIIKTEGAIGLYAGFSAGIARQIGKFSCVFSSTLDGEWMLTLLYI